MIMESTTTHNLLITTPPQSENTITKGGIFVLFLYLIPRCQLVGRGVFFF